MHMRPTVDATDEDEELFYEQLQSVVEKVNKHDLLLITGDINAKVGSFNHNRERAMGKQQGKAKNATSQRIHHKFVQNTGVKTRR